MTRLVSTAAGIGRLVGDDAVELLDLPQPDLGRALEAGLSTAEIGAARTRAVRPLAEVSLLAPIPHPPAIWALGWGYRGHRAESGKDDGPAVAPAEPFFFLKSPSSVIGPGQAIRLPRLAPDHVDYEGEIAVVIGRRASAVDPADALAHVAGYTIADDVTARDVQKDASGGRLPNLNVAKSFDTFTPMGPCLATPEAGLDPTAMEIETVVDGEVRQRATTADLLHPIADLLAYLSARTTLRPGDIVLTGTPAGVGFAHGRFLRAGSRVAVRVTGIGVLDSPVVGPDAPTAAAAPDIERNEDL